MSASLRIGEGRGKGGQPGVELEWFVTRIRAFRAQLLVDLQARKVSERAFERGGKRRNDEQGRRASSLRLTVVDRVLLPSLERTGSLLVVQLNEAVKAEAGVARRRENGSADFGELDTASTRSRREERSFQLDVSREGGKDDQRSPFGLGSAKEKR